jgi:hypothetical protein
MDQRISRFLVGGLLLLSSVMATSNPALSAAGAEVQRCRHEGWQLLFREDGSTFTSRAACTRYAARGGILLTTPPDVTVLPFEVPGELSTDDPHFRRTVWGRPIFGCSSAGDSDVTFVPFDTYQLTIAREMWISFEVEQHRTPTLRFNPYLQLNFERFDPESPCTDGWFGRELGQGSNFTLFFQPGTYVLVVAAQEKYVEDDVIWGYGPYTLRASEFFPQPDG